MHLPPIKKTNGNIFLLYDYKKYVITFLLNVLMTIFFILIYCEIY